MTELPSNIYNHSSILHMLFRTGCAMRGDYFTTKRPNILESYKLIYSHQAHSNSFLIFNKLHLFSN